MTALPQEDGRIPVWDGRPSSLDAFEEKVRMFILGTKKDERIYCAARLLGRMDPDSAAYKVGSAISLSKLGDEGGMGVLEVVKAMKTAEGPKSMQGAVKLFKELLSKTRRGPGEGMTKWTNRFKLFVTKVGKALHAAEPSIAA